MNAGRLVPHRLPGSARVLLFGDDRAHTTSVLCGAADWRRGLADRLASFAVGVLGVDRLPPTDRWAWPDLDPADLESELQRSLPAFRLVGAVVPRQPGRERLSLLGRHAGGMTVVKLSSESDGVGREHAALELLASNQLPGIATPLPLGGGILGTSTERVHFVATTGLGTRAQRPAIDVPLRTFERDLTERLGALPRPEGTPDDAVVVHGDLTPWNLRRTPRGLALFDWEAVGWGAAGSDLEHYQRASAAVRPGWRRKPESHR